MTLSEEKKYLEKELSEIYSSKESERIFFILLEHKTGFSATDFFADKFIMLTPEDSEWMSESIARLKKGEPVQYVVGHTFFCGLQIKVNPSVFIPRPETEELVSLIVEYMNEKRFSNASVLDVCSGSGCIAIALKKNFPDAVLSAIELSPEAIDMAKHNASLYDVDINFIEGDVFKPTLPAEFMVDVIVSNPPYVLQSEKKSMSKTVYDFEPKEALFVPDKEPLLFYEAISLLALKHLRKGGTVWFETSEDRAGDVVDLLKRKYFDNVKVHTDMSRKKRFVSGGKG
ncbi:MAG: peptide chain release factor N(5)-glutamine methyltransferase [Bacteroidia bacterium]|nr:peptide chain release factor N(5)-glutamine methyltransferase [Bacteroidia bacterium]